jgi:phosphomethylpyrimidine synthase
MKITQDVRDYAAAQGLAEDEALAAGLREKAAAFQASGQALYAPAGTPAGLEGPPASVDVPNGGE